MLVGKPKSGRSGQLGDALQGPLLGGEKVGWYENT